MPPAAHTVCSIGPAKEPPKTKPNARISAEPSRCTKCSRSESTRLTSWIHCDKCSNVYHWSCVAANVLDPIDMVDKWYCVRCQGLDADLKPTFKNPPRKSSRAAAKKINYADLFKDQNGDPDRFVKMANSKHNTFDASSTVTKGAHKPFRRVKGDELTLEWLISDPSAMTEPVLIDDPDALKSLGMRMPPSDISIREISNIVGPETPVEVIDVASQTDLSRWTLDQWATYYEGPSHDRVRNVISLEVSETPLGEQIVLPQIVRAMDWVETIWPGELRVIGSGNYPKVQKYCLMSVARCWTDWHIDFAGSSVFYHILRGSKVFYFIRPTTANLAKYEQWSGNSDLQESTWLGDLVNVVYKVTLHASDTMIIPTGWIHAVYTPTDSLVFGGNYLHSLNIPTQLRIHQIENNTKVAKKFRFPFFIPMLWFVADHYMHRLERDSDFLSNRDLLDPLSDSTMLPLPLNFDSASPIPARVLSGLLVLADFLIEHTDSLEKDLPRSTTELRKVVMEHLHLDQIPGLRKTAATLREMLLNITSKQATNPADSSITSSDDGFKPTQSEAVASTLAVLPNSSLQVKIKRKAPEDLVPKRPSKMGKVVRHQPPVETALEQPLPTKTALNGVASLKAKKDLGEIVQRSNQTPQTQVSYETRALPIHGALSAQGSTRDNIEVRTTRAENRVVRRWVDDAGMTVYETRTVSTVIEKAFFPSEEPRITLEKAMSNDLEQIASPGGVTKIEDTKSTTKIEPT